MNCKEFRQPIVGLPAWLFVLVFSFLGKSGQIQAEVAAEKAPAMAPAQSCSVKEVEPTCPEDQRESTGYFALQHARKARIFKDSEINDNKVQEDEIFSSLTANLGLTSQRPQIEKMLEGVGAHLSPPLKVVDPESKKETEVMTMKDREGVASILSSFAKKLPEWDADAKADYEELLKHQQVFLANKQNLGDFQT